MKKQAKHLLPVYTSLTILFIIHQHCMTFLQDITSPPSPPSGRVILQPWRWCQCWDPLSHRRTQWLHCSPFTVLFSPELGGTIRPLSTQDWQACCQVLFSQACSWAEPMKRICLKNRLEKVSLLVHIEHAQNTDWNYSFFLCCRSWNLT